MTNLFDRAAQLIGAADGLLITAGAGMGIDSGLPDFRGGEGFWGAYPALGRARMNFESIACPDAFVASPRLAWGFYGHRLQLYRNTEPHAGFALLRRIADGVPNKGFVFTSNVDGQFQKAGFVEAQICEVHGSIHHLQCMDGCGGDTWPADVFTPEVDAGECLLLNDLPLCPYCEGLARPNVLMFDDWAFLAVRRYPQQQRMKAWLAQCERPVVIEIGAGSHVPTVRMFADQLGAPLIRINPNEPYVARSRDVSLACGALDGISGIADALSIPTR